MSWTKTAALALVALTLIGCAGAPSEATPREPSVKPGINDKYFEDPSIPRWQGVFETESREIYVERQAIVEALGLKPGSSVADIGAGTGLFTLSIATAVGPQGRVFAVDIVPEFLTAIRERVAAAGLTNVEYVRCRADSVELAEASIDVAFICDTYHHFEHPRSTMASIWRALRPGGVLALIDFIRIEGVSRPWILDHVRAGQEVFSAEIIAAGFEPVGEPLRTTPDLKENYFVRFRRK